MTRQLAIVTGGSLGIGRRLVQRLSGAGYDVAFSYRGDAAPARTLVEELAAAGGRVEGRACDVGVKVEVDAFVEWAADWAGAAPGLLVNNAGIQTWAPLLDLDESRWDEVIRTNLKGCFLNTQAVARLMKAAGGGGAIVNMGSGCSKLAFPNLVDYTASKGGVEQFTKSAAIELGPFGVTVNCVAPGAVLTERTAEEAEDYASNWAGLTPLGRIGTPDDVADAVLFFAGPGARFVTGQTLWVDGGLFTRAPWIEAKA